MPALIPDLTPSIDQITSRNATRINVSFWLPGGTWTRVGRVQSLSEDVTNNVQALMELGSQYVVELKKGITSFTFSIAKMYVRNDVFDLLVNGAIFGLSIRDDAVGGSTLTPGANDVGSGTGELLEMFNTCAINSVSRSYQQGQATVAQNASVVVAGASLSAASTPPSGGIGGQTLGGQASF